MNEPRVHFEPNYHRVEGVTRISSRWAVELWGPFFRRTEEGAIVVWNAELTIWFTTYVWRPGEFGNDMWLFLWRPTQTIDEHGESRGKVDRYSYFLWQNRAWTFHGCCVREIEGNWNCSEEENTSLWVAMDLKSKSQTKLAQQIFDSVRYLGG